MNLIKMPLLILVLVLASCLGWQVPPEVLGSWESGKHKVTVRTEPQRMKFEFFPGSARAIITVNSDNTVVGTIGNAVITNGRIKSNGFLPVSMTGVAYIIKIDLVGEIFEGDPMREKVVELWVGPVSGQMSAELRYTKNGAQFPMGEFNFVRPVD